MVGLFDVKMTPWSYVTRKQARCHETKICVLLQTWYSLFRYETGVDMLNQLDLFDDLFNGYHFYQEMLSDRKIPLSLPWPLLPIAMCVLETASCRVVQAKIITRIP